VTLAPVRQLLRTDALWFVPGTITFAYGVLAVAIVELEKRGAVGSAGLFDGDAPAARTVLSVIAGSLVTVAGVTLSITIVVLQLTSSQFSPRIISTFFDDRLTQVTVGSFAGIFVFAIVVLGSVSDSFVPRLAVVLAGLLAIVAVALLIVFIHHVTQLIQVSHLSGEIARKTLARLDVLFPGGQAPDADDADAAVERWRSEPSVTVTAAAPGYLRAVDVERLAQALGGIAERAVVVARPGDFVALGEALVEYWPAGAAGLDEARARRAFDIDRERDLEQDVAFGLRQLGDTAIRALSPSVNDPTTACTCIGYMRSILVRLATRPWPPAVQRFDDPPLTVVVRRRTFCEHVDALVEVGRHADRDLRAMCAVLEGLRHVAAATVEAGARARASCVERRTLPLHATARAAATSDGDREVVDDLLRRIAAIADGRARPANRSAR
jgi:uncharacterized membrane protein